MASTLKKEWENKVLKLLFKAENQTAPTETYVALYTVAPTRTTTGTEATFAGYARKKVEASKWTLTEGTESVEGYLKNSEEIKFPECTGAPENEIEAVGIVTALSGGEQIAVGTTTEKKKVSNLTTISFAAGELQLKLS